jgi:hypothetical protein
VGYDLENWFLILFPHVGFTGVYASSGKNNLVDILDYFKKENIHFWPFNYRRSLVLAM